MPRSAGDPLGLATKGGPLVSPFKYTGNMLGVYNDGPYHLYKSNSM